MTTYLGNLKPGIKGTVVSIQLPHVNEDLMQQILLYGFVPGALFEIISKPIWSRNLMSVRLGHQVVGLSLWEANFIEVSIT